MAAVAGALTDADRTEDVVTATDRIGFWSAIVTAVTGVVALGFGVLAVPIAGANCPANCISYPYLDTASRFPRDYIWMFFAVTLFAAYLALAVSIHGASADRRAYAQVGKVFAIVGSTVLLIDYYVQLAVVPVSIRSGETQGIALLTQYNAHGLFIALEELGYLLMSLSFLFFAPVFVRPGRIESWLRRVFAGGFVVVAVSFVGICAAYGLDRQDRFEVIALSVTWLVFIVNGALLAIWFRRGATS